MADEPDDDWTRVAASLDWLAAVIATRLRSEPAALVWPVVVVGLVAGLCAEALSWGTGAPQSLVWVGTALTLSGYGMLAVLAGRIRRGAPGGARSAEAAMMAPWLRRLQVLMLVVLVAVVGLVLFGAAIGSWLLVARNLLEVGRVGGVVLALSYLLMDDEVGLPDWLTARTPVRAKN